MMPPDMSVLSIELLLLLTHHAMSTCGTVGPVQETTLLVGVAAFCDISDQTNMIDGAMSRY